MQTTPGTGAVICAARLSLGIFLPKLRPGMQLRYEFSDWENSWYVHHLYGDGLTNYGNTLGNWAADLRLRDGDDAGAQSHMLQLDWQRANGASYSVRYRTAQMPRGVNSG